MRILCRRPRRRRRPVGRLVVCVGLGFRCGRIPFRVNFFVILLLVCVYVGVCASVKAESVLSREETDSNTFFLFQCKLLHF